MVSSAPPAVSFPELSDFAAEMISIAQSDELIGVYVPGLFALPVQQQPAGRPEYVANENDLLTQFSLPSRYGSTALLAHNYLSGSMFAMFDYDQEVALIFGDGRIEYYRIERIQRFQALAPNSPFSQFVSLESPDGGEVLSSADLFNSIYTNAGELVFQTCIDAEGDPSWGRLFITATPIDPLQGSLPQVGQFLSNN